MKTKTKLTVGVALLLAAAPLAVAQSPGGAKPGNCHLNTIRLVAPAVNPTAYRPGYVNDQELIRRLGLDLGRGIPLARVDVGKLSVPHVIGVLNKSGTGFDHTAAVLARTAHPIHQRYDTSPDAYTQQFRTSQEFINQTVRFGGKARQTLQHRPGQVQLFCPGGKCTDHR